MDLTPLEYVSNSLPVGFDKKKLENTYQCLDTILAPQLVYNGLAHRDRFAYQLATWRDMTELVPEILADKPISKKFRA